MGQTGTVGMFPDIRSAEWHKGHLRLSPVSHWLLDETTCQVFGCLASPQSQHYH
jgi:hypothetical protein